MRVRNANTRLRGMAGRGVGPTVAPTHELSAAAHVERERSSADTDDAPAEAGPKTDEIGELDLAGFVRRAIGLTRARVRIRRAGGHAARVTDGHASSGQQAALLSGATDRTTADDGTRRWLVGTTRVRAAVRSGIAARIGPDIHREGIDRERVVRSRIELAGVRVEDRGRCVTTREERDRAHDEAMRRYEGMCHGEFDAMASGTGSR